MSQTTMLPPQAEAYCTPLLRTKLPAYLMFHNFQHTAEVVAAAQGIGAHCGLETDVLQVLAVAAWFHDTGYCCRYDGHEAISQAFASDFLQANGAPAGFREQVLACIDATDPSHEPRTMAEKVLRDADLSHLGSPCFKAASLCLRQEMEVVTGSCIPDQQWHRQNVAFLENHTFCTEYAQAIFGAQKKRNLQQERALLLST